jgi:hypothetical protein
MATIVDEGFESGLGAYSTSGVPPTTSALAAHSGSNGLLVTTAGGLASQILRTLPSGTRAHTFRFYFRFAQDTSGSASIYQADCAPGSFVVQARAGRKLRLYVGGTTSADSPVLNLNQWYLIDGRFVSSAATATGDLQIDTIPLTQTTHAQAAADQTIVRVGNTATNTYIIHVDDWKLTDQSADYPLGALDDGIADAITATGTGAATAATSSVKATAQRPTGTGFTWTGYTGELVVAGQSSIGQAFAISNDVESRVDPTAGQATATGAGFTAGKSSKPSIGHASATGTAHSASIGQQAVSEIASGLGAATDALPSGVVQTASAASAGTGAASNATPSAVNGATDPGLTLQMGI